MPYTLLRAFVCLSYRVFSDKAFLFWCISPSFSSCDNGIFISPTVTSSWLYPGSKCTHSWPYMFFYPQKTYCQMDVNHKHTVTGVADKECLITACLYRHWPSTHWIANRHLPPHQYFRKMRANWRQLALWILKTYQEQKMTTTEFRATWAKFSVIKVRYSWN